MLCPAPVPSRAAAEVVDDDAGAFLGEGQGVFAAQSPTGSGDDDDAILHSGHELPLFSGFDRSTLLRTNGFKRAGKR